MSRGSGAGARGYDTFTTVAENLPYAVMVLTGATLIALALDMSLRAWIAAAAYAAYGIVGALWIIVFLCPHCLNYGRRSCPSGYGIISAKLRAKGDTALFNRQFRRHIPAIVPLWIIPVAIGGVVAVKSFSWALAILLGVFVLNSFVILPLLSKSHGCKHCPQRAACPWMKK